ncbi:MAG TPA: universal stress protein [Steroidobacteraceae bacterium]
MQAIRRILVAVKDPRSRSLPAVQKAAQLARACKAELELFHAIAGPIYVDTIWPENGAQQQVWRSWREEALKRLEAIAVRLREKGVRVSCSVEWDSPVHEAIVRRALHIKADLIVAQCHEGRRLAPWLLRLTDWELLRVSPIPVLLIRNARPYRNPVVLAAVDPSHTFAKPSGLDGQILKAAAMVRQALRGTLHAVHAYMPIPPNVVPTDALSTALVNELQEKAEKDAQQLFDKTLKDSGIPRNRRHLVARHPIDAIQDVARETRASIVVMGAVSRSGLKRFYIGNTAERILGLLPCDVLVVKPARFPARIPRARRGPRVVGPIPLAY